MDSHTKSSFDHNTIQTLVKAQFGSTARIASITPLTAGWFNTAYKIHFSDDNPAAVLRIAPDPNQRLLTYEEEMMRKELMVYETIAEAVEALLVDGEALDVVLPRSYENIRGIFQRYAPVLDEIKEPALVHWDLWSVNIFIIQRNGRYEIEGFIDWERAYLGDPESEPAIATQHYGPTFYKRYGRELGQGRKAAIRHKLYRLYLLLVMQIEAGCASKMQRTSTGCNPSSRKN